VVTPVLLPRNLIAIDQSLKRGITTGFSFYLMTNTCVRMVLSWRAFCYCVPICMLSVFWTPSHLELYFFDRQDLFTVSDIHEQMGADIRSKDTESSSNCSGTSHMLCFFPTPRFTRFGNTYHASFFFFLYASFCVVVYEHQNLNSDCCYDPPGTWRRCECPWSSTTVTFHGGSRLVLVFSQEK
jgi:hypothetical protein